jgi:hypothetical protein
LELRVDLRARQVTTSVRVDAPPEKRPLTRVQWMLRQLRDAPPGLRIDASFANTRDTNSVLLGEAQEFPNRLLCAADARRDPRAFVVAMSRAMGSKRGKGQGSFVLETRRQVLDFYGTVVQDLKPWQPKPPQLKQQEGDVPPTAQPDPPLFSAVDQRDIGEGVDPQDAPPGAPTEAGEPVRA